MATHSPKRYHARGMGIATVDITGLVLAGGRGSRMGGLDKGLQNHLGVPLARHAAERLAPQVGNIMINANRNLTEYRSMGFPVWPDEMPDYPGPLAGMLAGLVHCSTQYLATVPCDTPNFPLDLVERLAHGISEIDGDMATAYTRDNGKLFPQPVFCLMKASLGDSLSAFVRSGERKTGLWGRTHRCAQVVFDDDAAFFNVNTLTELEQLQRLPR
jgi:molybdopterin-guanine dinucleotide biosynthesis protein A